jgi:hypothetical protein
MQITINWIEEKKAKSGKVYAIAQVKNESGAMFENVTIFGDTPGFAELKVGSVIEGDLLANDFNNKKGWKIQVADAKPMRSPSGMTAAVREKSKNIEHAQDRKDESIQKSSTFRDATMITVALLNAHAAGKVIDEADVKKDWESWRQWLDTKFGEELNPF